HVMQRTRCHAGPFAVGAMRTIMPHRGAPGTDFLLFGSAQRSTRALTAQGPANRGIGPFFNESELKKTPVTSTLRCVRLTSHRERRSKFPHSTSLSDCEIGNC